MSDLSITSGLSSGQRELLRGEYDNMLSCVRCGQCLTSCPTYVLSGHEAEGPRGRIAMMRALLEGQIPLTANLIEHEQNCLVCDACTAVCPAGVHMDPLQVALRTAIASHIPQPWWQRVVRHLVFRHLFPSMAVFRVFVRLIWLYQASGLQRLVRRTGLLKLLGLAEPERFLPSVSNRFLVPLGEVYPAIRPAMIGTIRSEPGPMPAITRPASAATKTQSGALSAGPSPANSAHQPAQPAPAQPAPAQHASDRSREQAPEQVSFFAGCVMSTALAGLDRTTVRVLQRAGCDVANTAGQGCCGALNAHGGDLEMAKELARRNIVAFSGDGQSLIVVNSAGCGAMLKDYAHHFREDSSWAGRAHAFSSRVRDVTEFLAGRPLPFRPIDAVNATTENNSTKTNSTNLASPTHQDGAFTFQDPCHLVHAQRIRQQPRTLLGAIPGLELREMAESTLCCGSAGIYNVTNPVESRALQQRKLDNALATGATTIVTANPGCLLQLRSGLAERGSAVCVKHIVEVLDEATAP